MRGIILASGRGQRLMPLTRTVPKCMIPVSGRTIFERQILTLQAAGVTDILVTAHHLETFLTTRHPDGARLGVRLTYIHEPDLSGLGTGIARCREALGTEHFVVFNDNVVADIDLTDLLAYHKEQQADATLVLCNHKSLQAHGPLDCDTATPLSALIGDQPDEVGHLQAAGIRVFSPRALDHFAATSSLGDAISAMRGAGLRIEGYILEGFWAELTTWERYASLLWEVGRGLVPEPPQPSVG